MEHLLQVRNLTIEYRSARAELHRAVADVSFDVRAGEAVGVMGESGCGKTSLALALLGLHERERTAVSGIAMLRGTNLLALDERELRSFRGEKIALVSQEPGLALCPVRRVGEQIAEVLHAHSAQSWKQCRAEAEAWLERVALRPAKRIWEAYPHQLSGGQLQRIALAQALICHPELLVADEPTASLDARSQAEFIELLRDMKRQLGLAVLLVSHSPEIQASLADRVIVMREGRIVEQGPIVQILRDPADPYTRALLSRAARVNQRAGREIRAEEFAAR
jgi:ABC-type glutathione transport system ATPase component